MRATYAHGAEVELEPGGDLHALGAAVTVELCGSWNHEGACPLAPHHTAFEDDGDVVRLRVLFASAPEDEVRVRDRIVKALASGTLTGPDGATTAWRLEREAPLGVRAEWADHAARLAAT